MSLRIARGLCLAFVVTWIVGARADAAPPQAPPFEGRLFSSSQFPERVAAGDLDGDGRLDLANTDLNGASLSILLGNGSGGFAPATTLFLSTTLPLDLELADVDANGTLDVLLVYSKTLIMPPLTNINHVEMRLNNGGAAFAAAVSLGLPNGVVACALAVGDVNGDGLADIGVAQATASSFSLLLGTAPGAFAPPAAVAVGSPTTDIALADVNHDGIADFAVAQAPPGTSVTVGLGSPAGFAAPTNVSMGVQLLRVDLVDVSGDGNADLVTANAGSPSLSALLGNGVGSFGSLTNQGLPGVPQKVVFGDWNGDGLLDGAATVQEQFHSLSVRLSTPLAVLSTGSDTAVLGLGSYLASGDFDRDGRLDLATSQINSKGLAVWRGDGKGGFGTSPGLQLQNPASAPPMASDLDHDGDADFVTLEGSASAVSVRLAVPSPAGSPLAYQPVANYPMSLSGSGRVLLADLNSDGYDDVLAAHGYPFAFDAFLNDTAGGLGAPIPTSTPTLSPQWIDVGDMNLDGLLDAVVAQYQLPDAQFNNRRVAVYLGNGFGAFGFAAARALAGIPDNVAVLDLNSDGKLDAAAHRSSTVVTLCFGDGAGGFVTSADFTVGATGSWLSAGDMNGDSLPDLVVSGFGAKVWLSNGVGSIAPAGGFAGISFGSPQLADLDGDADLDFAASDYANDRLLVSAGDGAGGLAAPAPLAAGHGPAGLTTVDFDKDGRVDLVSATAGYNGSWNMLVFHANTGTLAGIAAFGAGVPGCIGPHAIGVNALPKLGNANFAFTCTNAPGASLGLALVASSADPTGSDPFQLGVPFYVNFLSPFLAGVDFHAYPSGFAVAPAAIPNFPFLAGAQFSAQALWAWLPPACQPSTYGLSVSGGLTITIH